VHGDVNDMYRSGGRGKWRGGEFRKDVIMETVQAWDGQDVRQGCKRKVCKMAWLLCPSFA
jgi:hypothetical protein